MWASANKNPKKQLGLLRVVGLAADLVSLESKGAETRGIKVAFVLPERIG